MVYTPYTFDYDVIEDTPIQHRKVGNPGTKTKKLYLDTICAFDIETSYLPEYDNSIMYVWQFQIGFDYTIIGRTWESFQYFIERVCKYLEDDVYLVVYVHNLSFEFQFLKGLFEFTSDDIFALDTRKLLKVVINNHIELRCSYLQSNMSLDEFTVKYMVEHRKKSGAEFDYKKIRYPWTELTPLEMEYITNDVLGLVEAMEVQMKLGGDTLYTIPLTSTGYVRRDVKKAMEALPGSVVKSVLPSYYVYQMLREAFRGGNTHANRYYANEIQYNIMSYDRASSYPDVQCNYKYPAGKFQIKKNCTYDDVVRLIDVRGAAVLMRVAFSGIELSDKYTGAPYLTMDKSRNKVKPVEDNGRILSAAYLETTLTDIDFLIVLKMYKFSDIVFLDCFYSKYSFLPEPIRECNRLYFRRKTELKGVDGQELYYMKSKNMINSIYGMTVQNPVRQAILYKNQELVEDDEPEDAILEKSNKHAFLAYQWGVWTTAHARNALQEAIDIAGDNFVYCDTDSVKTKGELDLTELNRKYEELSKSSGAWADDTKGIRRYMGVYENETPGGMNRFITLGAKKYAYEYKDKFHITVAGVNKKTGAEEMGDITKFKTGFIFSKAGGTAAKYNDTIDKTVIIDGKELRITSNVSIIDSSYTLGLGKEYFSLLETIRKAKNLGIDISN